MNRTHLKAAFPFLIAALAFLNMLKAGQVQESWGTAQDGASSWQSGSTAKVASAPQAGARGGGASWSAGAGSFGAASQPGGVWHERSAVPVAGNQDAMRVSAAGRRIAGKSDAIAEANPVAAVGHNLAAPINGQSSRPPVGLRSSVSARSRAAIGGRSRVLGSTRGKPVGTRSRRQSGAKRSRVTGWKAGTSSAIESQPDLSPRSGQSLLDLLNSAGQGVPEDSLH